MVETILSWFEHLERTHVDYVVSRVNQMEGSQITSGSGIPRKIIRETIWKDIKINELENDMIFIDRYDIV